MKAFAALGRSPDRIKDDALGDARIDVVSDEVVAAALAGNSAANAPMAAFKADSPGKRFLITEDVSRGAARRCFRCV